MNKYTAAVVFNSKHIPCALVVLNSSNTYIDNTIAVFDTTLRWQPNLYLCYAYKEMVNISMI